MERRHKWLFPLMVLAACAVTTFGCVGIAAILGYLPLGGVQPIDSMVLIGARYHALEQSSARLLAQVDVAEAETVKASRSAPRRGAERGR